MYKRFVSLLMAAAAIFTLFACSDTTQPKEGAQYKTLPTPLEAFDLPAVTEVFSLTCGHCRTMEEVIPQLEEQTKQKFGKMHVTFNESAQISTFIFYTAVMQLKQTPDHAFMQELFAAVQMGPDVAGIEKQQALEKAFEKRHLISPYQLEKEQQQAMFALFQQADAASQAAQINAVPTFIVKGKYQVLTGGHKSTDEIAQTITYLLNQP
ncbi:thioredoxin domain-containing protein [Vibrio navarrensis]